MVMDGKILLFRHVAGSLSMVILWIFTCITKACVVIMRKGRGKLSVDGQRQGK